MYEYYVSLSGVFKSSLLLCTFVKYGVCIFTFTQLFCCVKVHGVDCDALSTESIYLMCVQCNFPIYFFLESLMVCRRACCNFPRLRYLRFGVALLYGLQT